MNTPFSKFFHEMFNPMSIVDIFIRNHYREAAFIVFDCRVAIGTIEGDRVNYNVVDNGLALFVDLSVAIITLIFKRFSRIVPFTLR